MSIPFQSNLISYKIIIYEYCIFYLLTSLSC